MFLRMPLYQMNRKFESDVECENVWTLSLVIAIVWEKQRGWIKQWKPGGEEKQLQQRHYVIEQLCTKHTICKRAVNVHSNWVRNSFYSFIFIQISSVLL